MKLVQERMISRSRLENLPEYSNPVLVVNLGWERRYRKPSDFFGFFDKKEIEWEKESQIFFVTK